MDKNIKRDFTFEERLEISRLLEEHDVIFKTFWSIGTPIFTTRIKTAAIGFDKIGKALYLIINPDFWDSLDNINKAFVISHEALHIILNHGSRGTEYKNQKLVNYAQDIVINEMLIAAFGFNKFQITNWDKYCFVETLFNNEEIIKKKIRTQGSFHYYMDLFGLEQDKNENVSCVDDHSGMCDGKDEENNPDKTKEDKFVDDLINDAQEFMTQASNTIKEEIEPILSSKEKFDFGQKIKQDFSDDPIGAGSSPMGYLITQFPTVVPKNNKWETIVKKHLKSILKYEDVEVDSWLSKKRSHYCLSDDLMLQGIWEEPKPIKTKHKIVFFLDSSGSCLAHSVRFVKMLKSIPEDKFEIEAYSFDNLLYPIDIQKGNVIGGGGTYFTILDNKIREITNKTKHPDAIFVLSDGDGNKFSPEKPKLWHWILTKRHSLNYIPNESPKHKMEDFS